MKYLKNKLKQYRLVKELWQFYKLCFSSLFFMRSQKIKQFDGFKLNLNISEYTAWEYFFRKDLHLLEEEFIKNNFKENDNAIDIGANIGFFTLLLSSISRKGTIHSFEPEKKNFSKLLNNISLNNVKNVKTYNLGLSDKKGKAKLYLSLTNYGGHWIEKKNKHYLRKNQVIKIERLDDILNKDFYQIIKIDTEGHELKILEGMRNILINKVNFIIIEHGESFEQIDEFLSKYSFNLFLKGEDNSIFKKL
jgi:FkbM family methyltransferase